MNKQEAKKLARETVTAAAETIHDVMSWVSGERGTFEQRVGRYEVLAAIALSKGADAKEVLGGKESWTDWGLKLFPGMSKATLYRWRNAGHVARVLQGEGHEDETDLLGIVPAALVGSLVPLYRVLDLKSKSDEARAKGRTLARETYKDLLSKAETIMVTTREGESIEVPSAPLFAAVYDAAESVAPTNRSGGKSKSDETEDETDKASSEDEGNEDESRRESASHLVTIDPAAAEAAAGPVGAILRQSAEANGLTEEATRGIMLAACRLCEAHGVSTVQAILAGAIPSAETIAEEAETAADETAVEAEAAAVAA